MNAVPPGVVGDVGDDGGGCVMQKDIGDAGAAVGNRCGFKSGSEVPQPQDETDNHSATNPANYKMEWEREKEKKIPGLPFGMATEVTSQVQSSPPQPELGAPLPPPAFPLAISDGDTCTNVPGDCDDKV